MFVAFMAIKAFCSLKAKVTIFVNNIVIKTEQESVFYKISFAVLMIGTFLKNKYH